MAEFNSTDHTVYDPDEVIFGADGSIESMTDADTGEVIKSDPAPAVKADPTGPYDGTDGDGNKPEDTTANRSGDADELDPVLADTLAVYGLDDDTIEWNGEETRVRDLSPEDRKEFLVELRERDRAEASGLTPEQRELIDFLNEGGDLRQALGVAPAAGSTVAALSADEVNLADIRQQYPALSEEEVQEELADRKASTRYEAKTGHIRERLTQAEQQAATAAAQQEYEQERQLFVEAGSKLKEVLGFPVEKPVLDYLLARTTTQEANGQSPFLNSLTPEKMLRLEYLDTYADKIDAHYKTEVQAAYKKGKADALNGAPSTPSGRGGSAGNTRSGQPKDDRQYADYVLGDN